VSNAIGYAEHRSRSHDAVIRVYDAAGNLIETHEHKGECCFAKLRGFTATFPRRVFGKRDRRARTPPFGASSLCVRMKN